MNYKVCVDEGPSVAPSVSLGVSSIIIIQVKDEKFSSVSLEIFKEDKTVQGNKSSRTNQFPTIPHQTQLFGFNLLVRDLSA